MNHEIVTEESEKSPAKSTRPVVRDQSNMRVGPRKRPRKIHTSQTQLDSITKGVLENLKTKE